jgi:hypothetical protein
MDLSGQKEPELHLEVSTVYTTEAFIAPGRVYTTEAFIAPGRVSSPQWPELHLDVSTPQRPLLHLEVSVQQSLEVCSLGDIRNSAHGNYHGIPRNFVQLFNGCPYAGNIFTIKNRVTLHMIILH